jgi:hypothetical protein
MPRVDEVVLSDSARRGSVTTGRFLADAFDRGEQ